MKSRKRLKLYPEVNTTEFDGLNNQDRLTRKVAIWFCFVGVFYWLIKLLFL